MNINIKKCPICGSILAEDNGMRCTRFPICTYMLMTDKSCDNYVMYDLETTGLSRNDHIIEIGAIYVKNGNIEDSFSSLCNPEVLINQRISEITGITNEMVKNEKKESNAIHEFIEWVLEKNTNLCVGHNINKFDNRMLMEACKRFKCQFPFERSLDTLLLTKKAELKKKGKITSEKQEELARYYGITYDAHRAVNDVEALFTIFQHLKNEVEELPIINF